MLFKKHNFENLAKVFFHDLKNKLLSIKLHITILEKKPEKSVEITPKINKAINESIDLVKDYLELEQYKKAKFLKHSSFSLDTLIKEIIEELDMDINKKNINLYYIQPKENTDIKSNKEWLKKALLNIIHNSIKYNKKHGFVRIKLEKEKFGYLITVKDSGIGIDIKKENIFDKYYTTDKKEGTGIGLSMSKNVIESLGGKIRVISEKGKGSIFYIYLPKISKKIKIKFLIASMAVFFITGLFIIDYFYCLIPQKIRVEVYDNMKIFKFQNSIIAKSDINDKIKALSYRNIFNTKSRNELFIKKGDVQIATNGHPVKIFSHKTTITNIGTEFETKIRKKIAISVFKGAIKAKDTKVNEGEGLIVDKTLLKLPLPKKVKNIKTYSKEIIKITWKSEYNTFKILLSKDKNFSSIPIKKLTTFTKELIIHNLNDGFWFISIQAVDNNLYSKPATVKILSLINYNKAKAAFENNNLKLAENYIQRSIESVKKDSYLPYFLYAKILYKEKKYNQALEMIKNAQKIKKTKKEDFLKAKIYFEQKNYKKVIKSLKKPINEKEMLLTAKAYYYLKEYKKANRYLYKILETNPDNKEAKKYIKLPEILIDLQGKKNDNQ